MSDSGSGARKPFHKRVWFWVIIIIVALSVGQSWNGSDTANGTALSEYGASSASANLPSSTPDKTGDSHPDSYDSVMKLNVAGMNWSGAYQKLQDADIAETDYTVATTNGKSVWLKSNWIVQSVLNSNGEANIMLRHMSYEEQSSRIELDDAERDLSSKMEDAKSLLASSDGKVADEGTRDILNGEIGKASSLKSDDLQQYKDETTSLQTAMDKVNESSDQKTMADLKASENAGQSPSPSQDQNVYYPNCTAVRAAGKAPLYEGRPGYSYKLDRDHDGVACEG